MNAEKNLCCKNKNAATNSGASTVSISKWAANIMKKTSTVQLILLPKGIEKPQNLPLSSESYFLKNRRC